MNAQLMANTAKPGPDQLRPSPDIINSNFRRTRCGEPSRFTRGTYLGRGGK